MPTGARLKGDTLKLEVYIPAYKGRFLKETLDSIAVQAHKDEFVLYIGDDASPERLDKIV